MLSETAPSDILAESGRWLDSGERERAARFARTTDARAFVLGRWLARRALADSSGTRPDAWTFEIGAHGKPVGRGPTATAPAFNLSHGGGIVACVVTTASDSSVGIDVEAIERRLPGRRLERFLTTLELEALGPGSDPDHTVRFWRIWTLKEAALKAAGTGVAGTLAAAEIDLDAAGGPRVRAGRPLTDLQLLEVPLAPTHCTAVAVDAPPGTAARLASLRHVSEPPRDASRPGRT